MRKYILIFILILILSTTAFARGEKHIKGVVTAVTSDYIEVSSTKFTYYDQTVFFRYYKKGASRHRTKIRYSDIRTGENILIQTSSGQAIEISVGDY